MVKLFATLVVALICAPTTADPHQPDIDSGYCPGGGKQDYCDGATYPDGSYWHTIRSGDYVPGHPEEELITRQCMIGAVPRPATRSGCGGEM